MIERYCDEKIQEIFSRKSKIKHFFEIQKELIRFLGEFDVNELKKAFDDIDIKEFSELAYDIEKESHHETASLVEALERKLDKKYGSYIHRGLTSSDILDTTLSMQIFEAASRVVKLLEKFEDALWNFSNQNKDVIVVGKTHGQIAEPISISDIVRNYSEMCERANNRIQEILNTIPCKLSGPVGNYSNISRDFEYYFNANTEDSLEYGVQNTQVISRDYHADLIYSLSTIGAMLEKIAVDIRLRSASGIDEFKESFSCKQKGSSAMPHKKNPILCENITGISRLLRSYVSPALENIALWEQRDMSHSSVERVIIEDSFHLVCFALTRMISVIDNLYVDNKKIKDNIEKNNNIFSHTLLVALMKKGFARSKAYSKVKEMSDKITFDEIKKLNIFSDEEAREILSLEKFIFKDSEY